MNRNIYFLLCTFFVFACCQASAQDTPPSFIGGHSQSLTVCENSGTTPINALLSIRDPDPGQTEIWSVVTNAAHGTLFASAATTTGGGGVVTPSGLSYTPATGYSGNDSFTVRVTDGTFADTTTVHVLINPIPGPITGVGAICLGLTTALADGGVGTWSTSSFNASVDPSSGVVTGVATGNATITYTFPSGCKNTRVVTVNAIPPAITGTFSICSGLTTNLNDGTGGTWSSNNTSVATINSGTGYYTGVSGGSVVITYTLPDGCTATTIVTINQTPPAISGATNVCKGTITTLSDGLSGGAWSSSNASLATIDGGGNLTGLSAGTVFITYTLGVCTTVETFTVNPVAPVTGAAGLCVGQTLTVSNTVSGGTWSSAISGVASVSPTGFVTAIAPGTSVITYETPAGCFSAATVTVNAVPLPVFGNAHICKGSTTSLSDADGGGTWASSNVALATVDASGVVTGVAAGDPIITYTVIGGCSVSVIVTVSLVPPAIGGVMTVCAGQTTSLSDGTGGTWTSTNTAVATINASSGYYTGVSADTVTMIYTLPGGCTAATVVTINQTPAPITGASVVCQSAELFLTETVPGGVWTSGNPSVATISGGLVTTVSAGSVTFTYTLGSCSAAKSILINPEAPITGITTICNGGVTTLSNAIGGGMWSSATPGVATVNPYGFVASVAVGTAVVTYALPTGCFTTASITVNLVPRPIVGTTHVCVGATTALSDPDGGGAWSSGSTLSATVNPATGVVTGISSGVPVITYMMSTGCYTTAPVVINPLPPAIGGTFSVCAGFAAGLIDGTGGTWTSANTLIATINPGSGYVSGILPGISLITYTLPTGCSVTATFSVNPNPGAITGPSSVCQGDSIILADPSGGGVWSAATTVVRVTSATATVTGIVPGLATVTYSIGSCAVSKIIQVNPITPVMGVSSLCNGASTILTDLTPTGTWSSSNTSMATITSVTGVLTGIAPGSILITYTSAAGCTAGFPFTVNPLPGPIAGTVNICVDSAITLSDSLGGGIWTLSTPSIASIGPVSGVLTAYGTGTLVITYTLSTGCKATTALTINPHPDMISGPANICEGIVTGFSDGGGGTWSSNDNTIATVNSMTGYVLGVSSGVVVISYSINGCASAKQLTVNPVPAPITGDSLICIGLSSTFVDAGGGAWTTNDETVGLIYPTGTMYGQVAGSATITYTLPVTGCYATKEVTVKDCHLEVSPLTNATTDIHISPNPNNGVFVVSGSLGIQDNAEVSVAITNMLGQVVYTNKVIAINGNIDQQIQIGNNLSDGMYIVNLLWGNEHKAFNMVIQE